MHACMQHVPQLQQALNAQPPREKDLFVPGIASRVQRLKILPLRHWWLRLPVQLVLICKKWSFAGASRIALNWVLSKSPILGSPGFSQSE